jgi:hypothetical protein
VILFHEGRHWKVTGSTWVLLTNQTTTDQLVDQLREAGE